MIKIKKLENGESLDLSSNEDLVIAIMNLISIEEHLFFTGSKTDKPKYFDLLNEVREIRKNLLKQIIKDYEGEVWCISKHLLAASMRLMEVGTKYQTKGEIEKARDFFKKSFDLYNYFWVLNVEMSDKIDEIKKAVEVDKEEKIEEKIVPNNIGEGFFAKIGKTVSSWFNCCNE